jgi:parallel beta-helix repeat protein
MTRVLMVLATLLAIASSVLASDFYIDPQHGDPSGDGSANRPWRSLQEVIDRGLVQSRGWDSLPYNPERKLVAKNEAAPIKPGDTIWLRSGDYGDVTIRKHYNAGVVAIAAQQGHVPRLRSLLLQSSSHWALKGLHISPEFGTGGKPRTMIEIQSHGWNGPVHDVLVEQCVLQSIADSSGWSAADWNERSVSGIGADGERIVIRGNRLKNVNFGISVSASHALIERNVVENFAGDGLRGLGNHSVFQHNLVKNCYDVNDNHDDGFQSWSTGPDGVGSGEVIGIVLRGNTIINNEDPDQPHRGTLQGIGCFDGMFVDWTIENNVVIVDHYHGITLGGARNCRFVNNTVFDPNDRRPGPAALRIGKHKRGTVSSGCTVRNNLVSALHVDGERMTVDHNLMIGDPAAVFAGPARFDLRLRPGSPAIDAGSNDLAPVVDIENVARPQGAAVDLGAYEYSPK